MSTRGCATVGCPNARAVKCAWCKLWFCDPCVDVHRHPEIGAQGLKRWREENAPEQVLATQIVVALNLLPGVHVTCVDSGGARQRNGRRSEPGMADVIGRVRPEGTFLALESKNSHRDNCSCGSCSDQRAWGAELVADGGIYLGTVRSVGAALDGVRMALARLRGEKARTA